MAICRVRDGTGLVFPRGRVEWCPKAHLRKGGEQRREEKGKEEKRKEEKREEGKGGKRGYGGASPLYKYSNNVYSYEDVISSTTVILQPSESSKGSISINRDTCRARAVWRA